MFVLPTVSLSAVITRLCQCLDQPKRPNSSLLFVPVPAAPDLLLTPEAAEDTDEPCNYRRCLTSTPPLWIRSYHHRISASLRRPPVSISYQCQADGTHATDFRMRSSDLVAHVTHRTASLPPAADDKAGLLQMHAPPKPLIVDLEDPSHG